MPRPRRAARNAPAVKTAAAAVAATQDTVLVPCSDDDDNHNNREEKQQHQEDEGEAEQEEEGSRGRSRRTRSKGTASRLSVGEQDAIDAAKQSRDAALARLANENVTTSSGSRGSARGRFATATRAQEEDSGSSVEVGRRAMTTPAHHRDTTGLDLADDDVFGDLGDSFADGDIPDGGLGSADASTMSFSAFRPRSRQSSFVGRNDPLIRPSSRGGNTPGVSSSLNIGLFRRRAREPSILGTSRKPMPEPSANAEPDDTEMGSEDDFAPEAESTPLNNRRRTQPSQEPPQQSPSSSSLSPAVSAASESRKRKNEDLHEDSERPEKVSRTEPDEVMEEGESDSDLSDISSPLPPPGLLERPVTPVNLDDITAPPASSGSEDENDMWPDIHTLAKRRRRPSITTPSRLDHLSDVSSPPSLTHSPNFEDSRATTRGRGRPPGRRNASPKLTTADLTSLLPKRRYKRMRNPFAPGHDDEDEEPETSSESDQDDQDSYLNTRATRKKGKKGPASRTASARPASRVGRVGNSALKPKQTPASARPASRSTRPYANHRSSDKENESEEDGDDGENENDDGDEYEEEDEGRSRFVPFPDNTFDGAAESGDTLSADELKQASKKFQEVDKWELEFEEVTESSSPKDAR